MHVGIFYFDHVKVIWGHSVHCSKNWAVRERDENLDLRGVWRMHVGNFDLEHVKVI